MWTKNMTSLLLAFILAIKAFCQESNSPTGILYALDEQFKNTTIEKARYLLHALKKSDTCWQYDTYNIMGPMISSEQYKDEKGTIAHGSFIYFNKNGDTDSSGSYYNGLQDGEWNFRDTKGRHYLQKMYKSGQLSATNDMAKLDSIEKAWKDAHNKVSTHEEIESDFPGNINGWVKYLTDNLNYPARAEKINKQGTVIIQFIVDIEGHIISPEIIKSVEYSIDQEALRLIEQSPAWSPAMLDRKKVKSYKKQPITFRL